MIGSLLSLGGSNRLSQDRLHKQSSDWCSGAAHAQTHAYNNFDTGKINKYITYNRYGDIYLL